jgi:hypothetical protein
MQFSNEKRKPNKCIINQKTKTYPTKQPKVKHLRKKLQIIQKFPLFLLQAYVNVKKNRKHMQKKFHYFQLQRSSTTCIRQWDKVLSHHGTMNAMNQQHQREVNDNGVSTW